MMRQRQGASKMMALVAGLALLMGAAQGQKKDFLTEDEIERVRVAQDPNERLPLYLEFARLRIDQVQSLLKREKAGRSILIHDLLEEYVEIVDAMDIVADDALRRKVEVSVGVKAAMEGQQKLLPKLEAIREANPKDLERYRLVLEQAIQATNDSIELAQEDLGKRGAGITAADAAEKKARTEAMSTAEQKERKKAEQKEEETKEKRKAPTLKRKGETGTPPQE